MRKFLQLLGIVTMTATAYGQADTDIVNIPDANFKKALIENININTNGDTEISYGEARIYTGKIDVSLKDIISLVGIEAFVNITELDITHNKIKSINITKNMALVNLQCSINQLTDLDVSKNTALETLWCGENKLTSLDVSNNLALIDLYCGYNQLTKLDISKNIALIKLDCDTNQLTSLDLTNNTALEELRCQNNQLTSLDVSKNTALQYLSCSDNQLTQLNLANGNNGDGYNGKTFRSVNAQENPNLMCIQIDSGFTPSADWKKDNHAVYSDNCNYPALSTNEKSLAKDIKVINPVKDNLIIKTDAKVERIEIYNTAGQLVKVLFKGNTNVQDLPKGNYLIKITTDQGVRTEKVIKD